MSQPDPDIDIYRMINDLSVEEERLWASAGDGRGLDPEERQRLDSIKVQLDRAYDLLHQRQALRAAGEDPPTPIRDPRTSWSSTSSSHLRGRSRRPPYTALVLELWAADDAFGRLDRYLRDAGFLERDADPRDDRVAHVYLAYGLSAGLRRTARPGPPEPARLPHLACEIRPGSRAIDQVPTGSFHVGPWRQSWTPLEHQRAISRARAAIAAGDIYQVNLVQHLQAPFRGDPRGVARALEGLRPRHGPALVGDGWAIVSASPELFLSRRGDTLTTMPIKGTRPRGAAEELRASPKDAAEHMMIVDLERNDLGRVCEPGSVAWPELMVPRSMAGVEHLVSSVTGRIRAGSSLPDLLAAMFPGGSVTGAPKVAAIDQIARLEPVGRGASMGALGVIHPNGDVDLALTIRTFAIVDERIHLWVGGGIVWDSDPAAEVEESWVKARPLLAALAAADAGAALAADGEVVAAEGSRPSIAEPVRVSA